MSSPEKPKPLPWRQYCTPAAGRWKVPFLWFEWICENISYHLSRWAFIELLEYVGKLSILGAAILFVWDIPQRRQAAEDARKTKHYIAWQTLNSAVGKSGNGGRTDALHDLHRDGISLAGVDLSGGVFPQAVVLTGADMQKANFVDAFFNKPRFSRVKLNGARIERTDFYFGDFRGIDLSFASLSGLKFCGCDFSSGVIHPDVCENVQFYYCQFRSADIALRRPPGESTDANASIGKTTFSNTIFKGCNFTNCHINIPTGLLTPRTFIACNLFQTKSGDVDIQTYAIKDHVNVSVPQVRFLDWFSWLGQNLETLAKYNPEYDTFYKLDDQQIRREWPTRNESCQRS